MEGCSGWSGDRCQTFHADKVSRILENLKDELDWKSPKWIRCRESVCHYVCGGQGGGNEGKDSEKDDINGTGELLGQFSGKEWG